MENVPAQPPDQNVFSDGKTKVDFVLVWEEPLEAQKEESNSESVIHAKWREAFLNRLTHSGLLIEKREVEQVKSRLYFVLLSAPWNVMCFYAEEISLRAPLQVINSENLNWSEKVMQKLSIPNLLSHDVPLTPPDYYTCEFRANKLDRFLGSDDRDNFFKPTQRHQVLYEILSRTPYGSVRRGQVGINRLINDNVFSAAFPLHQGSVESCSGTPPQPLTLRQVLFSHWAAWSCWRKYQPLDHIREYFGEKVALYFAWLGFYTGWLLPAAVMGLFIFLVGFWVMHTDQPAREVCDSGGSLVMCPVCKICPFWNYSSICLTYKAGLLFDNGGTVFLSVFMSLWAVTFLEYWKRTGSILSLRWDCSSFQDIEERPRPEFTAMAPMTIRNPVTGAEEPYFPNRSRLNRTLTSFSILIIMIAVVLIFLTAIILYRSIITLLIYNSTTGFISDSATKIASLSGSVLNLVVILILSRVYTMLAHILTRWEMHRTQSDYEDMFTLKVFIFQFVNFYSSPVYIAFFKGRFVGVPGKYNTLFGVRNEDCGAGGCLIQLAQELLVIMVGKQIINNVQELLTPKLKTWWHRRSFRKGKDEEKKQEVPPWERDYQLLVCEGLFDEYLEMVLQFGFITVFVAACPLAPLFALINNWVEIRLDAHKFVTEYRRPVAEQAQDIGIWLQIMQLISHIAVVANAFLIAFTSSFLPRAYYKFTRDSSLRGFTNFTLSNSQKSYMDIHNSTCKYQDLRDDDGKYRPEYFELLAVRLGFVIVFEHVVFTVGRLIDVMVPDVPEEVQIKIKREHYMAKEALAENQAFGKKLAPLLEEDSMVQLQVPADPTQS
ncbi:anoctamin-7 isoform X2 [Boleophthalmus pectinirostris]|uniref:anoctamin-7 isoform X2 n=1 Tax=Boleophthalmus pectinirostris TaxID=150288 RepID=UPI000A1C48D4|nr:anoctamin-7 isoform X2 [Boleophthalmus pectinirostris]